MRYSDPKVGKAMANQEKWVHILMQKSYQEGYTAALQDTLKRARIEIYANHTFNETHEPYVSWPSLMKICKGETNGR